MLSNFNNFLSVLSFQASESVAIKHFMNSGKESINKDKDKDGFRTVFLKVCLPYQVTLIVW